MSDIYFRVVDDVVIKHTPISGPHFPETGENFYKAEVVMTKEIFIECYKKWLESQESERG